MLEEKKQFAVYPEGKNIFSALNHTPVERVKVVILGQDPYHGPGQANGFCFSVNPGVALPPSLKNIFKELENDLGITPTSSGDLTPWADQGVLLLNATLTVRSHMAGSHQGKGWETFTDAVIKIISDHKKNVIFMLWGSYAKQKIKLIDVKKHEVLQSGHPSPLSANRGYWYGNRHFSLVNSYLNSCNLKEINW